VIANVIRAKKVELFSLRIMNNSLKTKELSVFSGVFRLYPVWGGF